MLNRYVIPIFVVALALALYLDITRGKKNQTFDGLYVRAYERSDFCPGVKACPVVGKPYWLEPTPTFYEQVRSHGIESRDLWGAWRLHFTGDLSSRGSYGHLGNYDREVRVENLDSVARIKPCAGLQ
jgi:hypothetical protein